MSKKPLFVLISDIHFTVPTLELASQALLKAQYKAKMLEVPLIIAGDTLDSKAVIRAECMNKLMQMLAVRDKTKTYIIVGNHDLINEKGSDHALNFLFGFCEIVGKPRIIEMGSLDVLLVPYLNGGQKQWQELIEYEKECFPDIIVGHQGTKGGNMGHYVMDPTAIDPRIFDNISVKRVFLGHYHSHYENGKTVSIGNPYTLTFGEAEDHPKGYLIVYDDGSYEHVSTNLRKHVKVQIEFPVYGEFELSVTAPSINPNDLVHVEASSPSSLLQLCTKAHIKEILGLTHLNFKLDVVSFPEDSAKPKRFQGLQGYEILSALVDELNDSQEHKGYLKNLAKEVMSDETSKS